MEGQDPVPEAPAEAEQSQEKAVEICKARKCPALLVAHFRDGTVFRFGSINRGERNASVRLDYIYKMNGDDVPFQGMRLTLKRQQDDYQSYSNRMSEVRVVWKYTAGNYHEWHGFPDKDYVLLDTENDEHVKAAYDKKEKIFLVKFSAADPESVEITGLDKGAVLADDVANDAKDNFIDIEKASLSLYMTAQYPLDKSVDALVEAQKKYLKPFEELMQWCVKAGVQWGQIYDLPPLEDNKKVEPRLYYHSLQEANFYQGYAEGFEALSEMKLVDELRNIPITAYFVKPPSAKNDAAYHVFCRIPNYPRFARVFQSSKLLSFQPFVAPPRLTHGDREAGKPQEKDNLPGFPAHVIPNVGVHSRAPLVLMVRRPKDDAMSSYPINVSGIDGDTLVPTKGYLKIRYDDVTIKATLKALASLMPVNKPNDTVARLATGLSFGDEDEINLLEGLTKEQHKMLEEKLWGSQKDCFNHHVTRVRQRLCLIVGPPGTGKTFFGSVLCEAFALQRQRTLISTATDAAADAAAVKFRDSKLKVVRAIPVATTCQAMLEDDQDMPAELAAEEDEETLVLLDTTVLQSCEKAYLDCKSITSPVNPRLADLEFAMPTCMLKVAGVIKEEAPRKWTERPSRQQREKMVDKKDEWARFRSLYKRSKGQGDPLGYTEFKKLKDCIIQLAKRTLDKADVILATAKQSSLPLLQDQVFDRTIIDESSVVTLANVLTVWNSSGALIMIGGNQQLITHSRVEKNQNIFSLIFGYKAFQRFLDLGIPFFMLKEQYRMKRGLMTCSNRICYRDLLVDGIGQEVIAGDDADTVRKYLHQTYPTLRREPQDEIQAVVLDVPGICYDERSGGKSKMNRYNIAVGLTILEDMAVKIGPAILSKVGIASAYAAQVRLWRYCLGLMKRERPDQAWDNILVGTTGFWRGKEAPLMIVDFVRAGNDARNIGFMAEKRRLNVLLSRQKIGLIVLADHRSIGMDLDEDTDTLTIIPEPREDRATTTVPASSTEKAPKRLPEPKKKKGERGQTEEPTYDRAADRNQHMKKLFLILYKAGRLVDLSDYEIQHRLVKLPTEDVPVPAAHPSIGADEYDDGDHEEGGFATDDAVNDPTSQVA